jgi:hypothetical protein
LRRTANVTEAHTDSSNYSKRNHTATSDIQQKALMAAGGEHLFVLTLFDIYYLGLSQHRPAGTKGSKHYPGERAPTCTPESEIEFPSYISAESEDDSTKQSAPPKMRFAKKVENLIRGELIRGKSHFSSGLRVKS